MLETLPARRGTERRRSEEERGFNLMVLDRKERRLSSRQIHVAASSSPSPFLPTTPSLSSTQTKQEDSGTCIVSEIGASKRRCVGLFAKRKKKEPTRRKRSIDHLLRSQGGSRFSFWGHAGWDRALTNHVSRLAVSEGELIWVSLNRLFGTTTCLPTRTDGERGRLMEQGKVG